LKDVSNKLDKAVVDRVPKDNINKDHLEQLIIMKDKDDDTYYVIRTQKKRVTTAIHNIQNKYKKCKEIIRIDFHPNVMKLWTSFVNKFSENIEKCEKPNWFCTNWSDKKLKRKLMEHSRARTNVK
jgi:hypothetical protein